ncbi:MAG: HD domain-containing protein [Candidatus Omnitrophica bacterium]|nr:HD domain-containing protein [Candidatus Omnitrophota bacterium]
MGFESTELFLKIFISSWQTARIYNIEHRLFLESLEKTYTRLRVVFDGEKELVIGILDEELASGEDIFFELSRKVAKTITYFKKLGIERIVFHEDVSKEELTKFISFLIIPIDEIKHTPQEYLSFSGIKNIEVGKIKAADGDFPEEETKEETEFKHYQDSLKKLSNLLDGVLNNNTVDDLNLKFITNDIMDNLKDGYQIFSKLKEVKSYDMTTFTHLLNVSILAIYFAHKLSFSRDDCLDIGVAGLFHDIGKLYIAKKIIQKKGKLDEGEFDKIKSHTVLGAEILLSHIDVLSILPVVVAFEHHLQYNLEGYPKLFFPHKINVVSSIIAICDVYDALIQRRSYKRDYSPETIYEIMIKDKGRRFDPKLLDVFFKIMGVWPQRTIVRLEDGRIAIVKQENEDDIFSPIVEVVDGGPKELVDLKIRKEVKIKQSLNPLTEGKKYLDLI